MTAVFVACLATLRSSLLTRVELEAEILALRHQLAALQLAAPKRPRLTRADRLLWVLLSQVWSGWRRAVQIVQPATVVCWHRRAFALYWRFTSRPRRVGRPAVARDIRALIRRMRQANPVLCENPAGGGSPEHGPIDAVGEGVMSNNSIEAPPHVLDVLLDEGLVRQVEQHRVELAVKPTLEGCEGPGRGPGRPIPPPAVELVFKDDVEHLAQVMVTGLQIATFRYQVDRGLPNEISQRQALVGSTAWSHSRNGGLGRTTIAERLRASIRPPPPTSYAAGR